MIMTIKPHKLLFFLSIILALLAILWYFLAPRILYQGMTSADSIPIVGKEIGILIGNEKPVKFEIDDFLHCYHVSIQTDIYNNEFINLKNILGFPAIPIMKEKEPWFNQYVGRWIIGKSSWDFPKYEEAEYITDDDGRPFSNLYIIADSKKLLLIFKIDKSDIWKNIFSRWYRRKGITSPTSTDSKPEQATTESSSLKKSEPKVNDTSIRPEGNSTGKPEPGGDTGKKSE